MAARQDQGLQIALIVFVFLFVVFAAMSYLFYKSSSDAKANVADLQKQMQEKSASESKAKEENGKFRQLMGFGEVDSAEEVEKTFGDDIKKYGGDPSSGSYRTVLDAVFKAKEETEGRESAAKEQIKGLKESLLAVEGAKEKQVVEFQSEMKKAQEDAAGERNRFEHDRKGLEDTKKQLLANLETQRTTYEGQAADKDAKIKELDDKLGKSEHAKQNLLAEVSKSSDTFEVADGRVSLANQDGTVWINLGSADSLRRQITFSVFDADQHDAAKATKKGSLEVTKVLGDHLAEARVTDDDAKNPILAGDQIYSQVWHRGKKLHFALNGVIDVNGDGHSDLQMVRDLVELNGGVVDAYLGEDGKVNGEITVNTRYLVMGKFPESATQTGMQKGWQEMIDAGKTNGVEVIKLDKFLNQIGYAPKDRTVQMGAAAQHDDFVPGPETGESTSAAKTGTGNFRPRSPVRIPIGM
ncbi:MAG TPA: hypothetical protein VGM76_19165 [Lacipirellulaceae bacterium]|jgi:hypothetical protein